MKMHRTLLLYFIQFIINHFLSVTRFFRIKRVLLNIVDGIYIGKGSRIVGPVHIMGNLFVGENTWIGNNFRVEGNGHVYIGNNCDIAPLVYFFTGTHEVGNCRRRAGAGINKVIRIGDGCWLCGGSKILPGVSMGNGTIVAAGAVVAHDFPDNVLVGGVPAKTIKNLQE